MIKSKKVVVVMPAYNASETLEKTYNEIPFQVYVDTTNPTITCPDDLTLATCAAVFIIAMVWVAFKFRGIR